MAKNHEVNTDFGGKRERSFMSHTAVILKFKWAGFQTKLESCKQI